MSTEYTITPHVAHVAAVNDARKALSQAEFDGLGIHRDALLDGLYDSLVDRFFDAADSGFTPTITDTALAVYHHAFDQTWMNA